MFQETKMSAGIGYHNRFGYDIGHGRKPSDDADGERLKNCKCWISQVDRNSNNEFNLEIGYAGFVIRSAQG